MPETSAVEQIYKERLLPGPAAWLLIAFMTVSLGIAYGYVFGRNFGVVIAGLSTVGIYFVMFIGSPQVILDDANIQVGDAKLPRKFIGNPKVLDEHQTRNSKSAHTHQDAYLVLRASIKKSILFEILDTTDPHPYWQFSTRNPNKLVDLLLL